MDISPMNLQLMVPKSTEVGQMQHNINQHISVQEDMQTLREKMDAQLKQSQVRSRENAEDGRIQEEPDRKHKRGGYHGQRREQQDEAEENERLAVDIARGQRIDISF